jgi:hypothetical protein
VREIFVHWCLVQIARKWEGLYEVFPNNNNNRDQLSGGSVHSLTRDQKDGMLRKRRSGRVKII